LRRPRTKTELRTNSPGERVADTDPWVPVLSELSLSGDAADSSETAK
jgi:hypothetical protein